MNTKAVKKGTWIAKFLARMADQVHAALFRYQVKTGLIFCAVEPGEEQTDTEADTESVETGDENGDAAHDDTGSEASGDTEDTSASEEESEVIVSIGEESPTSEEEDSRAPEWVRELRKANREKDRRIRELEQQVKANQPTDSGVVVGEKPTLEGCDYDEDRFARELESWHQRKQEKDAEDRKKQEAQQAQEKAWQNTLDAYGKAKTELKVKDFEDAEDTVKTLLNVTQQGVILHGAENPALVVYALGKNPKKAQELASLNDPVKFAFAVAKLETQLKVTPKKAAPMPDKPVRGSAPVSGTVDSNLERLRADAVKSGDFSKVHAYRRQQREKQRAA